MTRETAFGAAAAAYAVLGVLVVATYAPQQVVIWPPPAVRETITAVLPEGWSFFTRDPTGPVALPVRRGTVVPQAIDGVDDVVSLPPPGLSRDRRNALMQVEMVDRAIDARKDAVHPCVRGARCEVPDGAERLPIVNPLRHPTVCGEYDVHLFRPTPWFWRDLVDGAFQREGITRVVVQCRDGS